MSRTVPSSTPRRKLLFVCGRNKWRSPTAERIFSRVPTLDVRGRGLSASAVATTRGAVKRAAVGCVQPSGRGRLEDS